MAIEIELDADERELLRQGVLQWMGPSRPTEELARAIGFESVQELIEASGRLHDAIRSSQPLEPLDWARVLLSTEINFASQLFGTGVHWRTVSGMEDAESVRLLRSVQYKLRGEITKPGTVPPHPSPFKADNYYAQKRLDRKDQSE